MEKFHQLLFLMIYSTVCVEEANGHIVYVNKPATWDEARSNCTYTYKGRLASFSDFDVKRSEVASCVPPGTEVWTGKYSQLSEWVISKGCYALSQGYNIYQLDSPSVYKCFQKCSLNKKGNEVAIQGHRCICDGYYWVLSVTTATFCNITCDVSAICGGNGAFNIYRRFSGKMKYDLYPFHKCATQAPCKGINRYEKAEYHSSDCQDRHPYLCGSSGSYSNNVSLDWKSALNRCIADQDQYLTDARYHVWCSSADHESAWVSLFRSEVLLEDEGQDCYYTEDGTDYRGSTNITDKYVTCSPWSRVTNNEYRHLESNYCRNPSTASKPWCYDCSYYDYYRWSSICVMSECRVQRCDVPRKVFTIKMRQNLTLDEVPASHSLTSRLPYLCETDSDNISDNDVVCTSATTTNALTGVTSTRKAIAGIDLPDTSTAGHNKVTEVTRATDSNLFSETSKSFNTNPDSDKIFETDVVYTSATTRNALTNFNDVTSTRRAIAGIDLPDTSTAGHNKVTKVTRVSRVTNSNMVSETSQSFDTNPGLLAGNIASVCFVFVILIILVAILFMRYRKKKDMISREAEQVPTQNSAQNPGSSDCMLTGRGHLNTKTSTVKTTGRKVTARGSKVETFGVHRGNVMSGVEKEGIYDLQRYPSDDEEVYIGPVDGEYDDLRATYTRRVASSSSGDGVYGTGKYNFAVPLESDYDHLQRPGQEADITENGDELYSYSRCIKAEINSDREIKNPGGNDESDTDIYDHATNHEYRNDDGGDYSTFENTKR